MKDDLQTTRVRDRLASVLQAQWLPWLVFTFFLTLTYQLYQRELNHATQKLQAEFDFNSQDVITRISQRMKAYLQVLRGVRGFLEANGHVRRDDFKTYIADLQIQENYPGIQGLTFALAVAPAERERHIAAMRKEGFPDYRIFPIEPDNLGTPIIYAEIFAGSSTRVMGLNPYADAVRRAAMDIARDTGAAAISGRVTLTAATPGKSETGFLTVLPVYHYGAPHATLAERRANIKGWVLAPFRMRALMAGVFGDITADIEIHDGTMMTPETLLFDYDDGQNPAPPTNRLFTSTRTVDISGRVWTIKIDSLPVFEAKLGTEVGRLIAVTGITLSILLTLLTWLLVSGRERALEIARDMNLELTESARQTREAHARLLESEEINRFALEGTGMGVWSWDIATDRISFSPRYLQITQCVTDGRLGAVDQLTQCVVPKDVPRMVAELQAHLDGKTSVYASEYNVRTQNGQLKWLLNRGLLVRRKSDNRPLRMIGTITDLSTRKQTEHELVSAKVDSEHALAELASYIKAIGQHALISVTDLSGRIVEVNDRFCEISGYSRAELLGRNHNMISSGVHPRTFFAELWSTISRGDLWRDEICNRSKGGALYWVDTAIVPVKDPQGHISHYVSVRLDITERKQTEAELMRAMVAVAVADNANAAKSAFLANMSHEIRTPMNTVIGMTHLALKMAREPKQRDYLEKIQQSSQHLLRIINNILDFSKIEAGKFQLEIIDFDPATEIKNLASEMRVEAEKKGIELSTDIDPQLHTSLRGDTMRIRQILLNYIGNAIKFTHHGKIVVRAHLIDEKDRDCLVRFEVEDTGIGLTEAEIGNIFQAFHQADTSTTRNYGGTGLGLAISKQLAELMGGEVGVQSQPAQGSTFWFTAWLGRGKASAAQQAKNASRSDPSLIHGASVLLVEDNTFNQQVAGDLLVEAGAVVTIANNGQEALDCLTQKHFDCILMDIQMPVMDGLEATRLIRANPALSSIPVIGLTANAGPADQARCFKAGMNSFLSKPIDPAKLLAALANALARQRDQIPPEEAEPSITDSPPPAAVDAAATGTGAEVDLAVLARIVSDDPEKVRKYAQMFVSSMNDTLVEIESTLARADVVGAAALGHRAKSSARTVGATGFADLCQALEQCTRAEDFDKARAIIEKMRPLLTRIVGQINKEIDR